MNKIKAAERIKAIEQELEGLKKILDTPDFPPVLTVDGRRFDHDNKFNLLPTINIGLGAPVAPNYVGNFPKMLAFSSIEDRNEYVEAITTMLLLRRQPGITRIKHGGPLQYLITLGLKADGDFNINILHSNSSYYQLSQISPSFASREDANKAVLAIGEKAILRMFKTLGNYRG